MGIKHFKASEHSPESKSAAKVTDRLTVTTFDKELQPDSGTRRLMPIVYVVEKGKPYTYTAFGPTAVYVIEGEYILEDQSTSNPITFTKGDVALIDEGSIIDCSSPSKARLFGIAHIEAPTVLTDAVS